jgi:hypothetical protein
MRPVLARSCSGCVSSMQAPTSGSRQRLLSRILLFWYNHRNRPDLLVLTVSFDNVLIARDPSNCARTIRVFGRSAKL